MVGNILTFLGGIGLFLFGMETMTDALRELAGQRMRALLARFTTTPLMGAVTGALTTAVIQSSSATTVTAVGFVGAGLLTFPQALGVIFGANIGTTVTGWMVMLLGFKLKIGVAAMPLLFAASLLRILTRGNWARAGLTLAGFALLFLGLDMMQAGMAGFQGSVTPDDFPPVTILGLAEMVAIGAVLTAITQSSSAGVASALVLIGSGAIDFTQAAALVIGMNIGTTITVLLATVGGSRAMRQTAIAHLAFNLITGVVAFALLGLVAAPLHDRFAASGDEAALVAFHTAFNAIGVALILPFARPFARAIEWLLPEKPAPLTEALDRRLLADPGAAIDAARSTSQAISVALLGTLGDVLRPAGHAVALRGTVEHTGPALLALRDYLERITVPPDQAGPRRRYSALLHEYDHLHRLQQRCGQTERLGPLMADPALRRPALALGAILRRYVAGTDSRTEERLDRLRRRIESRMGRQRYRVMGQPGGADARIFAETDAMRWLKRAVSHIESIAHYSALAAQENPAELRPGPPDLD